ncbi:putative transcription factor & chromatin remodeling ARID family [Helianthus annuus]|nr:putative transcription factor & chromatin remodeling ARID family [Helianthus annuus]
MPSMLWVRNLRRYIRSDASLGSEARMEHETRRILLNMYKEKHCKSAEASIIPSFYKKVYEAVLRYREGFTTKFDRLVNRFLKNFVITSEDKPISSKTEVCKDVELFELYMLVEMNGRFKRTSDRNLWPFIAHDMGFDGIKGFS